MNTQFFTRNTEPDAQVILDAPGKHCELVLIKLQTGSDGTNNLAGRETILPHAQIIRASGKVFYFVSPLAKKSLVIISETPDAVDGKVSMENDKITVETQGCPIGWFYCDAGKEEELTRRYFAARMDTRMHIMVNNWGGGNSGKNISEAFVKREIDRAAELGLDIVQIDDGWQKISPSDTCIYAEDGSDTYYHGFDGDFWEVDTKKFPSGIKPLAEYAASKGVKLGLWFAPDARNCFANYERDLKVVQNAYYNWGVRFFKLDMVVIHTMEERKRYLQFLQEMRAMGDDLELQLDVTGTITRLGYIDGMECGKLFVENRYCFASSYYPHYTLRNLWNLAKYIPSQRLQMEIPNVYIHCEFYDEKDIFAPANHAMDYLFATVMVSNPLFWMEVQTLPEGNEALSSLIACWREEREGLAKCDIAPIGDEPNGVSVTGFLAQGEGEGYLVAIRESSDQDTLVLNVPAIYKNARILKTNTDASVKLDGDTISVQMNKKLAYAFIKLEK